MTQKLTHEFLRGELAYFLYAWPCLKGWLPEQNDQAVLQYALSTWEQPTADRKYPYDRSPEHDLFALKTRLGTTKGELPPGHSVMPNLLMYEVARRDKLPDAEKFFNAAHRQVEWMVENLDWEDPQTTKGQRMSEHVTMTGLACFLQLCPDRAPAGLRKKIVDWARVAVRRSDNMWDFRKLTDHGQWTPSGEKPNMWNEPGNVVGFPACALAAAPLVNDANLRARLHELATSHMDNCFGRNPCGRHFSYDAPREIEGCDLGWYSYLRGGLGRLATARFVLEGVNITPAFQQKMTGLTPDDAWRRSWLDMTKPKRRAMVLNLGRAARTVYVYLEDSKQDFQTVDLSYDRGSGTQRLAVSRVWEPNPTRLLTSKEFLNRDRESSRATFRTDGGNPRIRRARHEKRGHPVLAAIAANPFGACG